jgi:hypothetical protein
MKQQQKGILKCYYNGFQYIQEWEPISKESPNYEPLIGRSRYTYRRQGYDIVISLNPNALS